MERKFVLGLFLGLIYSMKCLALAPNYITCEAKSRGYLPYNSETRAWIGSGYLYAKGECHRAIDTFRYDIGPGTLCSWTGKGWDLYDSMSGRSLTNGKAYWFQLSTCEKAVLNSQNNVVCAPRDSGSGVYDITNGYFIGAGYYYDIDVCSYAAFFSKDDKVCAPNQGYTSIFSRRYNQLLSDELFMTSQQCTRLIGD